MIGLREKTIVRIEIDIEVIKGELSVLRQNSIDHPLEKLIAMWSDQIVETKLMVLFHKLEKYGKAKKNNSGRERADLR